MEKFQHKYRIPSARLQQWDYRWAGTYFITICTQNRTHYFGHIANGRMHLSHVGVIADILWYQIPHHHPKVELGPFVVMPNHIHGILIIPHGNGHNADTECARTTGNGNAIGDGDGNGAGHTDHNVETGHALSLQPPPQPPKTIGQQRYQNIGKNTISSMVGSYKSAVTKNARRLGFECEWQTRFYDHIIRDDQSFQHISQYIINNPAKWPEDKFHSHRAS